MFQNLLPTLKIYSLRYVHGFLALTCIYLLICRVE